LLEGWEVGEVSEDGRSSTDSKKEEEAAEEKG